MAENKLADMSTEFAIQILKLTENIKGHYSLSQTQIGVCFAYVCSVVFLTKKCNIRRFFIPPVQYK